jgi:YQGE family putative transporter
MLDLISQRFALELSHYRRLSDDVRRLLISYYLYLVTYPLLALFTNAYLWRTGESLNLLVMYNVFYCAALPLGFYLNGWLLRRFHTLKLYAVGAILQGLVAVFIVVLPSGMTSILIGYGLLAGLGAGLYWANKNYLSLRLTKGSNRLYYNSLESAGDMLINMVVPALAGLFIIFGEKVGWYVPETAYKWLMGFALVLVSISGYVVQSSKIQDLDYEPMLVKKPSRTWQLIRIYNILGNIVIGAEFVIPSVLILVLVGKEGTLGIVSSLTAVLSAVLLYVVGRIGNISTIWKVVGLASVIYLTGTIILAYFFSPTAVLIYMIASTIGWAFRWSPSYTIVMEIMDQEDHGKGQYAYVCDNEITFNIGRTLGLGLIFILTGVDQMLALRFVPVLIGITTILAFFPFMLLTKRVLAHQVIADRANIQA